jgi:hypothetical protein
LLQFQATPTCTTIQQQMDPNIPFSPLYFTQQFRAQRYNNFYSRNLTMFN